jgi:hypothetical protein
MKEHANRARESSRPTLLLLRDKRAIAPTAPRDGPSLQLLRIQESEQVSDLSVGNALNGQIAGQMVHRYRRNPESSEPIRNRGSTRAHDNR